MAVRFFCFQCQQLLSIATRKIGTEIRCPKCGSPQIVPHQSTASRFEDDAWVVDLLNSLPDAAPVVVPYSAAETAALQPALAPPGPPKEREALPPPMPSPVPPVPTPKVATAPITVAPPRPAPNVQRHVILLGVAVLLAAVGGVFAIGYLVGGYQGAISGRNGLSQAETPADQPVRIKGRAVYESASGEVFGDGQAVLIVVPEGKPAARLLQAEQLAPDASMPDHTHPAVLSIRHAGGHYARCQSDGSFDVALKSPGAYRALVISRHANRSAREEIDEADAREMGTALSGIDKAIAKHRYYWVKLDVPPGGAALHVHFGMASAKPI